MMPNLVKVLSEASEYDERVVVKNIACVFEKIGKRFFKIKCLLILNFFLSSLTLEVFKFWYNLIII